jgi:hypothetical protein
MVLLQHKASKMQDADRHDYPEAFPFSETCIICSTFKLLCFAV